MAGVELARKHGTTVLCSGEVDILTDGKQIHFVENGDSMMTLCTGTGCMIKCIAFLSVTETGALDAALAACITLSWLVRKVFQSQRTGQLSCITV